MHNPFNMILTWDTFHDERHHALNLSPDALLRLREQVIRGLALKKCVSLPPALGIVEGLVIHPRVNHSRWIVDCPDPNCGGAEFAREDKLFICQSCYNVAHSCKYLRTDWPRYRARIEEILLKRPYPKNRNWDWGDSLAYLRQQNKERGIE